MATKLIILSVATFIFGCTGVAFSLFVIITAEEKSYQTSFKENKKSHPLEHVLGICLDKKIIELITGMIIILSIFAMAFSVFLFVGVRKGKLGFVLAYFSYGIVLLILFIVSVLLEFLQGYWKIALITLFITGIYSKCLEDVYRFYDPTKNGIEFGTTGHTLLINEEQSDNSQC